MIFIGIIFIFFLFFRIFSAKKEKGLNEKFQVHYPIIEVSKTQVRDAIRTYSEELPKGVYRTILVKDDYSIDFEKLAPILKGIPSKSFFMSKETYDVFDESEKEIPPLMDRVQKAVDMYYEEQKKFPILPFDPLRRVNYYLLIDEHYLDSQPEIEFYITKYDGIISNLKPEKEQ